MSQSTTIWDREGFGDSMPLSLSQPIISSEDRHDYLVNSQSQTRKPVLRDSYHRKDSVHSDNNSGSLLEENSNLEEIDLSEIELYEALSSRDSPSHSRVYDGKCRRNSVAVKVVESSPDFYENIKDLENELRLLQTGKCHVPTLVGICRNPNHATITVRKTQEKLKPALMLISQRMEGTLESLLLEPDENKIIYLGIGQRVKMAQQAAEALAWINGKRTQIVHRDLKLENFLYDKSLEVKLNDFGLSILCNQGDKVEDDNEKFLEGNFLYRSPERLRHNQYDSKSDVYSFALILWQLMTRKKLPLSDCNDLKEMLHRMEERPPIDSWVPPSLRDLLQRCWHTNPACRPDFFDIVGELETIFLDVSIIDDDARNFWRENFTDSDGAVERTIDSDYFFERFWKYLGLQTLQKEDKILSAGMRAFKLLTEQVDERQSFHKVVSIDSFNRQIECWGPLFQKN